MWSYHNYQFNNILVKFCVDEVMFRPQKKIKGKLIGTKISFISCGQENRASSENQTPISLPK
jgi:hypothetical protein